MAHTRFVIIFARNMHIRKMKRIPAALVLAAILCTGVSCIREDEIATSPEAAIASFTIGYYDVLVNDIDYLGNDTVIATRESGTMYPMTVDQLNNRIYNIDSLAYGSVLDAVTCNIVSKGSVVYEYIDDPGIGYLYSSSEEIDFTRPLTFTVVSTDGSYIRKYDFKLNVHQVFPDSLRWSTATAPQLSSPLLSIMSDTLFLLGLDGSSILSVAKCALNKGIWSEALPVSGLSGNPQAMVTIDGKLYAHCGQTISSSTDGLSWTMEKEGVKAIYAPTHELDSSSDRIWMLDTDSILSCSADMNVWSDSQKLPALFPDTAATAVYTTLKTNSDISRALIAGLVTADEDTLSVFWNRLSTDTAWTRLNVPEKGLYNLPVMDNLKIIEYDGSLFALGAGLQGFYQSNDNGITWYFCNRFSYSWSTYNRFMQLPDGLKGSNQPFACVTDNYGGIWIVTSDGKSWYGSITRICTL